MLCYKHWLSHQTIEDDQQEMNYTSSSTINPDSDIDENENFSDLLTECTNHDEYHRSETNLYDSIQLEENMLNETISSNENQEMTESKIYEKEIEWWNEITPWKNSENFNAKIKEEPKTISTKYINKNEDSNYNIKQKRNISKKKFERSITCRSYCGQCPLTFDGAFGLIQAYHQHQLCLSSKNLNKNIYLYQHFHSKHGFTGEVSMRLVRAIIHQQDPYEIKLFSSINDTPLTLYDPFHKVKCPLSTRYDIINTPCLTQEITRKSIRRHLFGVHRLDEQTINKLIKEMIK
ncbi:unnamed protein product [Rotaria sordida]|uniref:Uncharacterized protein n=1 Tax=Rotaria sordida TaxID=392033 RepID=A0A818PQV3_9BILA|nr:unnamed protein product [Rotaria sordida]CAF0798403.1 unnamed protein product [Rotaria sordida]CAF3629368.1 unnamed protein product [Rotaria sordida]